MLAIAGLTFAYTSCTDYSEDIDKTNNRVDNLETKLADVEKQVASNKTAIEDLQKAKAEAEAAIKALQETVATLETKEDHKKDIDALQSTIDGLKKDVQAIDTRVKAIEDKLPSYATLEYVNATFATKKEMAAANEEIGKLDARLKIAEGQLKTLSDKYDSNLKISEIITKIDTAQKAAEAAQKTASEALGKVDALVEALGVYATKGALEAKITALEKADKDAAAEIENLKKTKLNISDFDKYFDEAIEKACKEGGEVYETVYKPLEQKISDVDARLTTVANALNARISKLWGVFNTELRSLVFVPGLYVDGIEAVEYCYGDFGAVKFVENEYEGTTDAQKLFVLGGAWDYANEKAVRVNPAVPVEYEMNPSSAVVTADNALKVVVREAESVSTRSAADLYEATLAETKNGNLFVNLTSNKVADESKPDIKNEKENITIFALQANVKISAGEDTTVTSDYARIYESRLMIDAISYNSVDYGTKANACEYGLPTNHLFTTAPDAVANKAELKVDYKGSLDIKKLLETHYFIYSITSKNTHEDHVYETDYPENDYGLSYKFSLVDYYVDGDEASESSFAAIDENTGVITPGVNGEVTPSAIDRQPLVRVTVVTKAGDVVAVGYIKVQIAPKDYIKSDGFNWTVAANDCENSTVETKADEMTKIYVTVDADEVAFDKVYALQTEESKAVQYSFADTKFTEAAEAIGVVTEKVSNDGVSTLEWVLTPADKSAIYKKEGHTATIWVRYVFIRHNGEEVEDEFEGVYVPLKVTVTKNAAGTVGVKLANYWFDNQTKAILNVKVPNMEPGKPVPSTWVTPINQVWEGNNPKFTVAGKTVTNPVYKYYFAPVQPKVGNVQLTVDSKEVVDLYDGKVIITDNAQLSVNEVALSADYEAGVYTNTELKANGVVIATINQETGEVTYENNETAKALLNYSPSVPKSAAELYANIGVVLKAADGDCNLVAAVAGGVNPYYFLRPLNMPEITGKVYRDGVDAYKPEANLSIFDVFEFKDWRGDNGQFVTPDYSNLWYFKYYNVNNFKVDEAGITTTLNGGVLGETLLSSKTNDIHIWHCTGDITNPTRVPAATGLDITYSSETMPNWGEPQYNGLKKKFGYLRYVNNGNNVDSAFMLRIPVQVTYEWGVISTYVDVTVEPTL